MHVIGVAAVVASLALALGISSSDARAANVADEAGVRMMDATPLTLRGVGFEALERVRLTVILGEESAARTLRAGVGGRFTAVFPGLRYGRCGPSLSVKAVGARGSRAAWKLVPLDCPDRADS